MSWRKIQYEISVSELDQLHQICSIIITI